jgi:hypothetical protein
MPSVEALPEAALALFTELGIEQVLREAQSVMVDGFENRWGGDEIVVRSGSWIHLERSLLAKAAIREAVRRGSSLSICSALPRISYDSSSIALVLDGVKLYFDAAVDATGRSALWSRSIHRKGNQVADIYRSPAESPWRGRIARDGSRWTYRLGLEHSGTVAIMAKDGKHRNLPDTSIQNALGISSRFEYAGRRPAFPQWCKNPVLKSRLAIGDAALAYDPLAGQGICFALSSAFAASATIRTWRDAPLQRHKANRFYRDFVDQRRRRHLNFLERAQETQTLPSPVPRQLPNIVVFSGEIGRAEVQIDATISAQDVVRLQDNTRVRWLGSLDLLDVRKFAQRPIRTQHLVNCLISPKCSRDEVVACMHWCIQHRVLNEQTQSHEILS